MHVKTIYQKLNELLEHILRLTLHHWPSQVLVEKKLFETHYFSQKKTVNVISTPGLNKYIHSKMYQPPEAFCKARCC